MGFERSGLPSWLKALKAEPFVVLNYADNPFFKNFGLIEHCILYGERENSGGQSMFEFDGFVALHTKVNSSLTRN